MSNKSLDYDISVFTKIATAGVLSPGTLKEA